MPPCYPDNPILLPVLKLGKQTPSTNNNWLIGYTPPTCLCNHKMPLLIDPCPC
jgi:hypothetical protein